MRTIDVWTLLSASALLVNALPISLEAREANSLPQCGDLWKEQGWKNQAPWKQEGLVGDPFCASKLDSGRRIVALATWREGSPGNCENRGAITRVEVTYDDEEVVAIGSENKACEAGSISLEEDELISYLGVFRATDKTWAQGTIKVKTTQNGQDKQSVKLGKPAESVEPKPQPDPFSPAVSRVPWNPPTGSGILVGLTGYVYGDTITQLNFQFKH